MKGKLLGVLSLLIVGLSSAFAQTEAGKGAVAGVVMDPTKAVVPNATITLSNAGIGYKQTVTSNSEGYFSFQSLNVVDGWNLTITASGFASSKVASFPTSVGTVITENVTLSVGNEGTVVEVQGGTIEQVQTDTTSISQVIDAQVLEQSPLLLRDANSFVGLTAGAAADSANTGRGFAVNGARTGTGNFLLEGFDNNDQGQGGGGFSLSAGAVVSISPDAVREYRVISSVSSAEYGRAGGFVTDSVLKSGTNSVHGSAFEYSRIQALAQNNFFSKRAGLQDHLVFNQFGGGVGFPIFKDKTFFQGNVEGLRLRQGSPDTYTGITQDFYNFVKSGNYQQWMEGTAFQNGGATPGFCPATTGATCPGKFADVATLGPVFTKIYNSNPSAYPFGTRNLSNQPTDLLLGGNFDLATPPPGVNCAVAVPPASCYYQATVPVNIYGDGNLVETQAQNLYRGSGKLDHRLTSRDQLAFTYAAEEDSFVDNLADGAANPGPGSINYGGAQIFGARVSHTFTPNLLNEFRAGYLRHVRNFVGAGAPGVAAEQVADSPSTGFGVSAALPQYFTENQFSYEDAVTYTKAHHSSKAGFRFIRTRNGSSFYNDVNGTVDFWGSAGLLTDGLNEVDGERVLDGCTNPTNCATGANHTTYGTLYAASASQNPITQTAPDPYRGYRANEFAAYIQDDWKATSRLLLNYGLRWEYFGPPHNFRSGVDSNVYFGSDTTLKSTLNPFAPNTPVLLGEQNAVFACVGTGTPCGTAAPGNQSSTIWDRDLNNFAPRVGFSYDTFGTGKFVIRGGFGIGYDRLYNNAYENIRFNGPFFVDNTTGFGNSATAISESLRPGLVQAPFAGNKLLTGASPVPRHVNQHLKTAYYEQMHLGFETNILKGYVVEANYIGNLGRQLIGLMNANTFEGRVACSTAPQKAACTAAGIPAANQTTTRPNVRFGNDNFRTNGFSSNYNSGQVSLRRGYSHGFQFAANYTYSKALDQVSDVFTIRGGGTGIATPYNPSHNYGPADFDVRHQFTLTANFRSQSSTHKLLLAGWGFSPIFTAHSGTPIYTYSSASTYDPNKDGTNGVERTIFTGTGNPHARLRYNTSPAGNGNPGTGAINKADWALYTCPASVNGGLFCDVPSDRNTLYGLRQYNLDVQANKEFTFHDRYKLIFQAAFFNVDGHTRFGQPNGDLNSTNFGQSTTAGIREGQLSGRIEF